MMKTAFSLAAERESKARMPGREAAGQVRQDWNGKAEVALPDVGRSEPVVGMARVGVLD